MLGCEVVLLKVMLRVWKYAAAFSRRAAAMRSASTYRLDMVLDVGLDGVMVVILMG